MHQFPSRLSGFAMKVDVTVMPIVSPDSAPAPARTGGPRLAAAGRIGPKCRDCRDFVSVVTRTGVAVCTNSVHADAEAKPPLPMRPDPARAGRSAGLPAARPAARPDRGLTP
ncbi:hypothetical protein ACFQ2Y_50925 [Streptomyces malaysiensis subsp. malaysiensis]|uniref:hypothetical protein n=1 Tax=Streptomyces TaxID=1883 RepID=UPI001E44AE5D|nr:hypothetical protein [Streptomyces sp. HNM0561]UHH23887.1 hypothetical protein LUV23_47450 [Streptomyces sp. HNM0561]